MPHSLKTIAAALLAVMSIQNASAELYISPVMRQSVGHEIPDTVVVKKAQAATLHVQSTPGLKVSVSPASSGIEAGSQSQKPISVLSSGTQVPLPIALSQLVDDFHRWSVAYDIDVDKHKVSWSNAESNSDALDQIKSRHNLYIAKDEHAKRIAISRSESVATQLLEPGVRAWRLEAGKSLRDNLVAWGDIAGWKIDMSQTDVNYPTDHEAKLIGRFEGRDGVVDRLLKATHVRTTPLNGHFYNANHVVVVVEAGYKPERAETPNVDQSL